MKESEKEINWARAIIWLAAVVVLFLTNPKEPERHKEIMERRAEHIALVINAEANRIVSSYGGLAGVIGLVSVNQYVKDIKKNLKNECRNPQITNLGILSWGSTDTFTTLGILGIVIDLTGIFVSDQDIRDTVASSF